MNSKSTLLGTGSITLLAILAFTILGGAFYGLTGAFVFFGLACLLAITTYIGLIPFIGFFLYWGAAEWIINGLTAMAGIKAGFLTTLMIYTFGAIALITTIITSIVVIVFVLIIIAAITDRV